MAVLFISSCLRWIALRFALFVGISPFSIQSIQKRGAREARLPVHIGRWRCVRCPAALAFQILQRSAAARGDVRLYPQSPSAIRRLQLAESPPPITVVAFVSAAMARATALKSGGQHRSFQTRPWGRSDTTVLAAFTASANSGAFWEQCRGPSYLRGILSNPHIPR